MWSFCNSTTDKQGSRQIVEESWDIQDFGRGFRESK